MKSIFFNLNIAFEAILANKLRATLTALGIIFGVSAVITMLAVGNGAQEEILEQIKLVGVNNIVISSIVENKDEKGDGDSKNNKNKKNKTSTGLTLADAESIQKHIPNVSLISPEVVMENTNISREGKQTKGRLVGVLPTYFQTIDYQLAEGQSFSETHLKTGASVCIIGRNIQAKFFSQENPIGKQIKCGKHWLTIIGVLESKKISANSISNLGIRDYNLEIYAPIQTLLVRYLNRGQVTKSILQKSQSNNNNDDPNAQKVEKKAVNYHQIDRLVIQVKETDFLAPSADIIQRMLLRRHQKLQDFDIKIPELLLKQQQRTKDIFNLVLGAIAAISLIVGGIGIMNIMLASVLERIKEIGLRMSLGAKKSDIVLQFMFEAVLISMVGGILGVILGVVGANLITTFSGIPTIVKLDSVFISFGVSASIGLIFGILPARKASMQDPITSLRYE